MCMKPDRLLEIERGFESFELGIEGRDFGWFVGERALDQLHLLVERKVFGFAHAADL